jgi:hypothetical protein
LLRGGGDGDRLFREGEAVPVGISGVFSIENTGPDLLHLIRVSVETAGAKAL